MRTEEDTFNTLRRIPLDAMANKILSVWHLDTDLEAFLNQYGWNYIDYVKEADKIIKIPKA